MKKKYTIEIELDTEVSPFEKGMGVTSPYSRKFERQIAVQIERILDHVYNGQITACVSIADHSNEEEIPLKNKDLTELDNAFSIRETIYEIPWWEDENAETLEDKLRDEHTPIPEEKEDSNLFKSMTDKFTEKMEDINGPEAYDSYYEDE
jgi:hypothetical protein